MKLLSAFRLLRPHQWIKSVFVVTPLFFSERLFEFSSIYHTGVTVVLFCFASSSVYIVNDIFDVEADRAHSEKRLRPIAASDVSIPQALTILCCLIGSMAAIITWGGLSPMVAVLAALFLGVNLAYSSRFKRVALIEMFFVASGYIVRVMAGSFAVDRMPSQWVIVCAGTLSMLIVVGKRREEVARNSEFSSLHPPYNKYSLAFLDKVVVVLASMTLVAYLLFTVSEYASQRFNSPYVMLTSVLVALGIFRYMQIIVDETGASSPSSLVIRDKTLLFSIGGWLATFYILMYL